MNQSGTYGTELETIALTHIFNIHFEIYLEDLQILHTKNESEEANQVIRLAFYQRGNHNAPHYDAIEEKGESQMQQELEQILMKIDNRLNTLEEKTMRQDNRANDVESSYQSFRKKVTKPHLGKNVTSWLEGSNTKYEKVYMRKDIGSQHPVQNRMED